MALRGTLEDMGVIELIQFPHQGKKSGELIIVGTEHEARLYYSKGKLVHAATRELTGHDVLENVVDWAEGDFEFRPGVEAPETSIETDLHRAVMLALKARDEKKMEQKKEERREEKKQEKEEPPPDRPEAARPEADGTQTSDSRLTEMLHELLKSFDSLLHAGVMDKSGNTIAAINNGSGGIEREDELKKTLYKTVQNHPRPGISRIITEDENGIAVMLNLDADKSLVVAAGKSASLGAVSINAGKMARKLKENL